MKLVFLHVFTKVSAVSQLCCRAMDVKVLLGPGEAGGAEESREEHGPGRQQGTGLPQPRGQGSCFTLSVHRAAVLREQGRTEAPSHYPCSHH